MAAPSTERALGRALLARQHLLARTSAPVLSEVAHLVGLQAQNPRSPYLGLWTRLDGFTPADLVAALTARHAVRIAAMRSTIHLLTAADARELPTLHAARLAADLRANPDRRRQLEHVRLQDVAAHAREILDREPLTAVELGARLAPDAPGVDPAHLAMVARCLLPLAQVPPRGLWGRSGRTAWTTVEAWIGTEDPPPDGTTRARQLERLVERYLAAFGPASVADMQAWSGLTGLRTTVAAMRDRLLELPPVEGSRRELFDLPDAPRPDCDVPAPARFLPDFDNLLLGHADRTRVVPANVRPRLASRNGMPPGTVLVDGSVAGTWALTRARITSHGARRERATLEVTPWRDWTAADREEVEAEAEGLVRFWADSAQEHIVVLR